MKYCRPVLICLCFSFAIVIMMIVSPVSYADKVFTRGAPASFIEITGKDYVDWKEHRLTGDAACVKTGRFPAPTPPYADVEYCACMTSKAYANFPAEGKAVVIAAPEKVCKCNWVASACQWLANTCLHGAITGTTKESCRAEGGTYWHTNGHCGKGPCQFSTKCGPEMRGHFFCQ
jgi:hypothetical protein